MAKVTYDFLFEMDYAPTHVLKFVILFYGFGQMMGYTCTKS